MSFGPAAGTGLIVVDDNTIMATTAGNPRGIVDVTVTGTGTSTPLTGGYSYKDPTTTTLGALAPANSGSSVTFTATVTGSGASGSVDFMDNGALLGSGTLSGGSASYTASGLAPGSHPITAVYNGDTAFLASTSASANQVIRGTTVISLSALAPNPSTYAQPVSMTATVGVVSGPGSPSGTVNFFDGATQIGSGPLSSGSAMLSLNTLAGGGHSITATYVGDGNFQGSTTSAVTQTVNKATTSTAFNAFTASTYGQSASFTAVVTSTGPVTATGSITFSIDGTPQTPVAMTGNSATFSTSSLTGGSHAITASYSGDGNFLTSSPTSTSQTVNTAGTTTTLAALTTTTYGTAVTFTATVVGTGVSGMTGSVTFMDGATPLGSGTLTSGSASFTTTATALTAGAHSITAVYGGDGNFSTSTSTASMQIITKAATTMTLGALTPSTYGQAVTFSVTVTGTGATGTVTFSDNGSSIGTGTLTSGSASFTTSTTALAAGAHPITATYGGDNNFLASSAGAAVMQTVSKAATTTTLITSSTPTVFGQNVTFTSNVTTSVGVITGNVTFTVDGTPTVVAVASGAATLSMTTLSVGAHTVTAAYGGDSNFLTSNSGTALSQTVNKGSTSTIVTTVSPNPSIFGESVSMTASVTILGSAAGTITGIVTFKDGATTVGSATVTGGTATFSSTALAGGAHSITAIYGGDTNFVTSTSPAFTQTTNKGTTSTSLAAPSPNLSLFGIAVNLSATVAVVTGSGTLTGTVTFKDGATTIGSSPLSGTTASFSTAALSVGSHTITAVYSGDNNFQTSTSASAAQTVNQGTTVVTISSATADPTGLSQPITFNAAIAVASGAGTPTGTVTFKDGATTIGSAALSGGSATFSTTALQVGPHSITAVYAGDANFVTSTSPALPRKVSLAISTVKLESSGTPSAQQASLTLTATVASTVAGTVTGTVTFRDGATVLGTGTVSGGKATFTTTTLSTGGHSLTASYSGDVNYGASSSAALLQTVQLSCSDAFANATPISGASGTAAGTTIGATGDPGEPNHAGVSVPLNSVWCVWTAPVTGQVSFDTTGSNFDTTLAAYLVSEFSFNALAANDNISATTFQSRVSFLASAGAKYFIAIDGPGTATGNYVLSWSVAAFPSIVSAVLPSSRSVQTGNPATAFATVINTSQATASQCSLALPGGFPGTFSYQSTNAGNIFQGLPNTPVDIAPNAAQNFFFSITPTADINGTDVAIQFSCANASPAASVPGLNTLTLTASASPSPDEIAIAASPSADGIVTAKVGGTAFFAASAVNIGSIGDIIATVDDNGANLPLTLTLCRTTPATGACLVPATPGTSSTWTFATNDIGTYAVFVKANAAVAFDPARNRIVLRLRTADGVTRGSTSVAVRTQ